MMRPDRRACRMPATQVRAWRVCNAFAESLDKPKDNRSQVYQQVELALIATEDGPDDVTHPRPDLPPLLPAEIYTPASSHRQRHPMTLSLRNVG